MFCKQETYLRPKDTHRLKEREWEKVLHANGNQKQAGVVILISENLDFKTKTLTRDKKGHNLIINKSIQEKEITIINTYRCNIKLVKLLGHVRLFATPWTVAHQAPPSMGFSRQEYWSGWPFPSPGDLPDPGIEPRSPTLQADALTSEPPGKPNAS